MQGFTPVSQLLTSPRDGHGSVAFDDGRAHGWEAFQRDVSSLMARLERHGGTRWLVLSENAYALAVGLLAGLHGGHRVALPANFQSGHLADIAAGVDGVITHEVAVSGIGAALPILGAESDSDGPELRPLDGERSVVVLHTSGTTGDPLAIEKPLRCLEAEVATLETVFGRMAHGPVLASVPPYHIYGLLFRVLWPLSAGRPFAAGLIRFPEDLEAAVARVPTPTLVSSPAFLKRALPVLDLRRLRPRLGAVFCSGGPFASSVAAAYNAVLAAPVVEVYGSTETGGIGYRSVRDAAAPEPWRPMPGVALSVDRESGILAVRSPFLPDDTPFGMADRASIAADGRFTLGGRADRIVKMEERRVSLAEVEQHLAACHGIAACRVLPLNDPAAGRQSLAAVIVPSDDGWTRLGTEGKQAVKQSLRSKLTHYLDANALPRKWRFVRQMPETALGKTTDAVLAALFAPDQGRNVEPTVVGREAGGDRTALRLRAPRNLIYFDGHFDVAPILPGVVQVGWALRFAREAFALSGAFQRLESLKFFRVIMADQEFTLELSFNEEKNSIGFQYGAGDIKYSSGRIVLGSAS